MVSSDFVMYFSLFAAAAPAAPAAAIFCHKMLISVWQHMQGTNSIYEGGWNKKKNYIGMDHEETKEQWEQRAKNVSW